MKPADKWLVRMTVIWLICIVTIVVFGKDKTTPDNVLIQRETINKINDIHKWCANSLRPAE